MDGHTLFTQLKQILADLYVEPADAKRVATDAGLDLTQIPFDAKAINTWHNILVIALEVGVLDGLLVAALGEYAQHRPLVDIYATYHRFTTTGGQLPVLALLISDSTSTVIKTAGGSYVAGNAAPGRDFIGRDQHNYYTINKVPIEWPLFVNVPPQPNLLIGRDALLQKLVASLLAPASPALSAEGLPGVGKTTLAVALAHHPAILAHFKDGVLWGGLGKQGDAMPILAAWAERLGQDVAALETAAKRAQAVKNAIGHRSLLLVIDDAWDLETAQLLRCGGVNCCHLLTTRDQALARTFAGKAQVATVPVLDDETAYQLLAQLAPEACAAEPATAQRLIQAVGGMPLTVELLGGYLAAPEHSIFSDLSIAALTTMSVPQQRLQLAARRLGSLDDRKTTLHETITLSVVDLPEAARTAFYALGAFAPKPETFDRLAAETISKTTAPTLALLIARNLVEIAQDQRLALHQTLAEVAQLATTPETIAHHRSYYLALVNEDREDWQRIELVYGQLKWAWTAAPADPTLLDFQWVLATYQRRRGLWSDLVGWLQRVRDLSKAYGWQTEESRYLHNLGYVYHCQGRWDDAINVYEESLRIARKLGDRYREGDTFYNLGLIYYDQGRWTEAIGMYEENLRIKHQLGDRYGIIKSTMGLGNVYKSQGRWEEAIIMYRFSLLITRELGDRYGIIHSTMGLGNVYKSQGRWGEAIDMYEESLRIARKLDDRNEECNSLNNLGLVYYSQGRWEEAIGMYEESLRIARELGDRHEECNSLNNLGIVYTSQERWEEAIDMYEKLICIARELDDRPREANTLNNLGIVYKSQGRWEEAICMYEESLHLARELGDRPREANTLNNLGIVYDSQGRWGEAIDMYEKLICIARELGDRPREANTLNSLGLVYYSQEHWIEAISIYEESLCIVRELGDHHEEGNTLNLLGLVYYSQNEVQKADIIWREALTKLHPDSSDYKMWAAWLQKRESNAHE